MADTITPAAKAKYLESGGLHCPYCDSRNIEADRIEIDQNGASANCNCGDCGREWVDLFTLTGVE